MSALDDLFAQIEDQPFPGGCEHCDALQTVREESPGVYVLTVAHDDWCPALRAMKAGSN
jgi:hypothetical protein